MNTDEKGNELPTITHYKKWEQPTVYSRCATYPYELRPVKAWCRLDLRGEVFHVHESFDEDWENHDVVWCFTEQATGARVLDERNAYPGVCMENGWRLILKKWKQYHVAKKQALLKIHGVVNTPAILLCI